LTNKLEFCIKDHERRLAEIQITLDMEVAEKNRIIEEYNSERVRLEQELVD